MPTFDTTLAKDAGAHYDWWVCLYCRSDKGLGVFTGSKEYFLWVFFFALYWIKTGREREKV